MRDIKHKILLLLTALTIVGEFVSIFFWTTNRAVASEPSSRFVLAVDWPIAVANVAVFIVLNLIAFIDFS